MKSIYTFEKVGENLYNVTDTADQGKLGIHMYFIIGEEKALIFDTGFGVVDTLRQELEQYTDKPIICVVGHGHPDHAGAAELFDVVYMNHKDESLLPDSLSFEKRMGDVFREMGPGGRRIIDPELKAYAEEHIVDPGGKNFHYIDTNEGDTFDIGGDVFEVFELPWHTQGSIGLLNREKNYCLVSDSIARMAGVTGTNFPTEKRVGLENFRSHLEKLNAAINDETLLWYGHSYTPLSAAFVRDTLTAVNEVLAGNTENDEPERRRGPMPAPQGKGGPNPGGPGPGGPKPGEKPRQMYVHQVGEVSLAYDRNLL